MVMGKLLVLGRPTNLTALFLGRLRPPKRLIKLLYLFHNLLNPSLAVSQKSLCVVIITNQLLQYARASTVLPIW